MNRTFMDFLVGVFVVIGLGSLMFLAIKVGNLGSTGEVGQTYTVYAKFDNVGNLKVRAPVKSAGVVVGRVARVSLDKDDYRARVKLKIDTRYQFPKDTTASILTSGLLGEQYVGFEPGGDVDNLKANDEMKNTQSALVLERLISQFMFSKASGGDSGSESK